MAHSKKKSVSQKIVGVATTGMPSPIRKLLGLKIVAILVVLIVPVLFATGVLQVRWNDGRPRLSINRAQSKEIREKAAEKVEHIRRPDSKDGLLGPHENALKKENRWAEKPISEFRDHFGRKH